MTYPDRTKHWPAESSAEYRASVDSSWAPSWTTVGRMRDIGAAFVVLFVLILVGGLIVSAVLS